MHSEIQPETVPSADASPSAEFEEQPTPDNSVWIDANSDPEDSTLASWPYGIWDNCMVLYVESRQGPGDSKDRRLLGENPPYHR